MQSWISELPLFFFSRWNYQLIPLIGLGFYVLGLAFSKRIRPWFFPILLLGAALVYGFPVLWFIFWTIVYVISLIPGTIFTILGLGDSQTALILSVVISVAIVLVGGSILMVNSWNRSG